MPPPNCSTIRQMRQLSCILDSCTISAATKSARRKKPYCLCHAQPKVQATSSEELNAQISPRTDDEHNLPAHEDYWQEHWGTGVDRKPWQFSKRTGLGTVPIEQTLYRGRYMTYLNFNVILEPVFGSQRVHCFRIL